MGVAAFSVAAPDLVGTNESSRDASVARCEPVTLQVYDMGDHGAMTAINKVLRNLGTGAFHCGVEVYGQEWNFQGSHVHGKLSPGMTGLLACTPKRCQGHIFRESVPMKPTVLSRKQVKALVSELQRAWLSDLYDPLELNCCHFCRDFCQYLGSGEIPGWVTHLANFGADVLIKQSQRRSLEQPPSVEVPPLRSDSKPRKATFTEVGDLAKCVNYEEHQRECEFGTWPGAGCLSSHVSSLAVCYGSCAGACVDGMMVVEKIPNPRPYDGLLARDPDKAKPQPIIVEL